jgi:DNA-binding beta-propeller fold protein YncE
VKLALAIAAAALGAASPLVAGERRLPGAHAVRACAAAGPYWPTMTLAIYRNAAWVACKEQGRVLRVDTRTGKRTASLALGAPVIAVAAGYRSLWALDAASTLYRIDPARARITRRTSVGASRPYNVWTGGNSVWVIDDGDGSVIRVSRTGARILNRFVLGDGPADIAFGAASAWVIDHRDRRLWRIDLASGSVARLATIPGDAPERLVLLGGSLWITGRGTDLLKVSPDTGAVETTIDVGASGIDVIAVGASLWVPARSAAVDQTGFPTMDALRRVSAASGEVTTAARPTGRVDVHGLAAQGRYLWLADNTDGFLYRVAG